MFFIIVGVSILFSSTTISMREEPSYSFIILKGSFHIHTTFSDGKLTPEEVVNVFSSRGYDVIAITDHSTLDGYARAKAEGDKVGLLVIPGQEVSSTWSDGTMKHIVALFINERIPEKDYWRTEEVEAYFRQIHLQGGIAIVAHPFSNELVSWNHWSNLNTSYSLNYVVDGWETAVGHGGYTKWLLNSGEIYLSSVDFHDISTTSKDSVYNLVISRSKSMKDVKEAIMSGRVVVYSGGYYYGSPEALELYIGLTKINIIKVFKIP